MDHNKADSAELASILRDGLFTRYFDSTGAASWRDLITNLKNRGEILHAKRIAWICLFHPRVGGRNGGAMALINMYDLSNPGDVYDLLSLDNDCLRNMFVKMAEGGSLVKYDIAPHLAWLLENKSYLRRNRRGKLVYLLRALYHYKDSSVACKVAQYLGDPIRKVRENAARTLGKITGHTFSRTGDMDFTPNAYYVTKARIWWSFNKDRPEYNSGVNPEKNENRIAKPERQIGEGDIPELITQLQSEDFFLWGRSFKGLFEFGFENEEALARVLKASLLESRVDAVYGEILLKLCAFYNKKRKTTSEYQFKRNYDFREFCY